MRGWARQLWSLVRSRQGLGTLMIAAFGAVALGVVPNLVQSVSGSVWMFAVVFVVCVGLTVAGWVLLRPRAVGVVVALYPSAQSSRSRTADLTKFSQAAHGSTLVIDREQLRLDALAAADRTARVKSVVELIDARIPEFSPAGGLPRPVVLYPAAQLADGFELGRQLKAWQHGRLTVMHSTLSDEQPPVVPGLVLSDALLAPLSAAQQGLLASYLDAATLAGAGGVVNLVEVPDAVPEVRHRLGLVVRLAANTKMVADAVFVTRTGRVVRDSDGKHTGYVLNEADPSAPGLGCGAYAVVEITEGYLPNQAEVFAAMTMFIGRFWVAAARQWEAQVGGSAQGVLFFHGPLPIAIGLGWVKAAQGLALDFVPHEMTLAASQTGAPA